MFTVLNWPVNNTNVIHTHDYLRRRWGSMFVIEETIEHAHGRPSTRTPSCCGVR